MSDWFIRQGDCMDVLATMPANSVHCVCTSPPYFGLRDYGVSGQIGLEPTPAEFVAAMVRVFREVRRVMRPNATLWLNLGDSYAANRTYQVVDNKHRDVGNNGAMRVPEGLKPKDLMMMPARVALALCDDGWYLRSDIIWCKRAPMPESVTDRPTTAHEHIFLLTKQPRYFYDAEAIREAVAPSTPGRLLRGVSDAHKNINGAPGQTPHSMNQARPHAALGTEMPYPAGRNAWSYWLLSPEPFPAAHFATFPTEIPRRAILAGTSEHGVCAACGAPWRRVVASIANYGKRQDRSQPNGVMPQVDSSEWRPATRTDKGWQPTCSCGTTEVCPATVLDCFSGAGTTVLVANRLGRRGIGIELSSEYVEMSRARIINDAPLFNMPAVGAA